MVCKTLSCRLRGAQAVTEALSERFGVRVDARGATTADGRYHIESAECLGLCDMAPCMLVGEDRYGPLTPEDAVRALEGRP
jgi:NADH-quinone oxidoreductase subunit E